VRVEVKKFSVNGNKIVMIEKLTSQFREGLMIVITEDTFYIDPILGDTPKTVINPILLRRERK